MRDPKLHQLEVAVTDLCQRFEVRAFTRSRCRGNLAAAQERVK
jgi:hypothetical protein